MNYAKPSDLKEIYGHFQKRKDVFPHVRQDKLRRMIETGQVLWQDGVVITYQRYRRAGRVAATCPLKAKAGDVILHQILNTQQFSGKGGKVFKKFVREIVKPSGGDLYLSVRKENAVACSFYERHGMSVVGKVAWSGGTLPGLVYRMAHN
jgi:FR47-like protein